jgi:hypothetical protein
MPVVATEYKRRTELPRNSSGAYTLPDGYLATTGQTILASQHNPPLEDIATALTGSLPRNGTCGMLANLPMGGFKITGLANGSASTDAITKGQLDAVTIGTVTETGTQTLSNKTLSFPTIVLKQSASPAPTANGDMQWDSDDFVLAIGNGSSTRLVVPSPASSAIGDLEYFSGIKAKARLGIGTASQVLQVNAGATAPQWATMPFTKSFESAQQTIAQSAQRTVAHGLGVSPTLYQAYLQCISADWSYNVGDEILAPTSNPDLGSNGRNCILKADSTNLYVQYGNIGTNLFVAMQWGTGADVNLTSANWRLVLRAWA